MLVTPYWLHTVLAFMDEGFAYLLTEIFTKCDRHRFTYGYVSETKISCTNLLLLFYHCSTCKCNFSYAGSVNVSRGDIRVMGIIISDVSETNYISIIRAMEFSETNPLTYSRERCLAMYVKIAVVSKLWLI